MSELFATFRQHLVWSLMLWVVMFAGFAAVFARGRLTQFARGIGRVLWSIVVSPFVFIRRAVATVLGFTPAEEAVHRSSGQYLLNKGLLVLQALLIVVAIGALSAAVVATWNTWVPPSEVRRAAREYRLDVEQQRQDAAKAAAALTKLDTDWKGREKDVIARYRGERTERIARAEKETATIEQDLNAYASPNARNAFAAIQQRAAGGDNSSVREILRTRQRLDGAVPYSWYISSWEDNHLKRWNELWYARTLARHQLESFTIDELRAAEQPEWAPAKETRDREANTLARMEERLLQHEEAASLKWKVAAWRALASFVSFLLFVWLTGIFVEAAGLAVRVADDVRRLRETVPGQQEALAVTMPEVRLPIRDGAVSHGTISP